MSLYRIKLESIEYVCLTGNDLPEEYETVVSTASRSDAFLAVIDEVNERFGCEVDCAVVSYLRRVKN